MTLTRRILQICTPSAVVWLLTVACSGADDFGGLGPSCSVEASQPSSSDPPWDAGFAELEQRVLELGNEARARGGCCGSEGCFDPSPPLKIEPSLRAAARLHARDMVEQGYFAHDSPGGTSSFDRMRAAGFRGCAMGENLAEGPTTPSDAVQTWLESPSHCANLLNPRFTHLGVGYYEDDSAELGPMWVQDFGG